MTDDSIFRPVPPEIAEIEKRAILNIYSELEKVKDAGHDNWQTLSNLISNLLADFDNPYQLLEMLMEHIKLKIRRIREMRTN
jgi:hypothetical protein